MASQEGMSYQFVVHVYEAITKQIQQFDVKVSVLLSWNGVIAVLLGRELVMLFSRARPTVFIVFLLVVTSLLLVISSFFCYRILRPQIKHAEGDGIFWAGDILRLGSDYKSRVEKYLSVLKMLQKPEDYARQIVQSIVGISEILMEKNKLFFYALISTISSFVFLVILIVRVGLMSL